MPLRFMFVSLCCLCCCTRAATPTTPTRQLRAVGGLGVGDSGIAGGAQIGFEHRVEEHQALGAVFGMDSSAAITLGPQRSTTLGYGAAVWRLGTGGTVSDSGSRTGWAYSLAIAAGAGLAMHRSERGDCGFKLYDDGTDDPFNACVSHLQRSFGGMLGAGGNALHSFGRFGVGIELSGRFLFGPVPAVNITSGPVVSLEF